MLIEKRFIRIGRNIDKKTNTAIVGTGESITGKIADTMTE